MLRYSRSDLALIARFVIVRVHIRLPILTVGYSSPEIITVPVSFSVIGSGFLLSFLQLINMVSVINSSVVVAIRVILIFLLVQTKT